MWLDIPFAQVSRSVEQNMHTTFSFPNPVSESQELQWWGHSKILLSFLMRFYGHLWTNQQQQQCFLISSRFWKATTLVIFYQLLSVSKSRVITKNIWSVLKPFATILVFLSQIGRLWNKILWQFSVHFRHPWRTKKTDFTRQVIDRTLSKIIKRNSVFERMSVDNV